MERGFIFLLLFHLFIVLSARNHFPIFSPMPSSASSVPQAIQMNSSFVDAHPTPCSLLLQQFKQKELACIGKIFQYSGVGKHDVYNISAPFSLGDTKVKIGRVEPRDVCANSQIFVFEEQNEVWVPTNDAPSFPLEDGFVTHLR